MSVNPLGALHDHEARPLQVLHKPLRHDLGHDLVRVTDAPAALVTQREGERRGQFGGMSGRERVAGAGHRRRVAERRQRSVEAVSDARLWSPSASQTALLGWPLLLPTWGSEKPVCEAPGVTALVIGRLRSLLADPVEFLNAISNGERDAPMQKRLRDAAAALCARWEHGPMNGREAREAVFGRRRRFAAGSAVPEASSRPALEGL